MVHGGRLPVMFALFASQSIPRHSAQCQYCSKLYSVCFSSGSALKGKRGCLLQKDVQMEETEASTSQALVPSPVRPGQEMPPQISRRVLEYANHLARHKSEVARDLLRLHVPTPEQLARRALALQVGWQHHCAELCCKWLFGGYSSCRIVIWLHDMT